MHFALGKETTENKEKVFEILQKNFVNKYCGQKEKKSYLQIFLQLARPKPLIPKSGGQLNTALKSLKNISTDLES